MERHTYTNTADLRPFLLTLPWDSALHTPEKAKTDMISTKAR